METISAFDVIGPVMVGPSSSHTAGALRIATLVRKLVGGRIASVEFVLYGSFAETCRGHGTDRALVAGILGFSAGDLRIRDSFQWAEKQGLHYSLRIETDIQPEHPNTVESIVTKPDGTAVRVVGVSTGGGAAELRSIDGVAVVLTGEYNTVFIRQKDEPGVVGYVANCLANHAVNIAFMRLYREGKGKTAYTIVETDECIDTQVLDEITAYPSILSATLIE